MWFVPVEIVHEQLQSRVDRWTIFEQPLKVVIIPPMQAHLDSNISLRHCLNSHGSIWWLKWSDVLFKSFEIYGDDRSVYHIDLGRYAYYYCWHCLHTRYILWVWFPTHSTFFWGCVPGQVSCTTGHQTTQLELAACMEYE